MGLKILYRNPRRPGEAGMKLVPDPSQRAAEKEILKGLGFTVIGRLTATPKGVEGKVQNAIGDLMDALKK